MSHRPCSARLLQLAAAATVALCALPAQALTVVDVQANGHRVSTDFVGAGLAGLDVGLLSTGTGPVRVTLALDAGDIGQSLFFNAIVSLLDQSAPAVTVTLDGASFAAFGSATALGAGVQLLPGLDARSATAAAALVSTEFYLGNPLLEGGTDWRIDLANAQAGDRFSITISAVPEPGTWALMLGGLGAVALAARRRG